MSGYLLAAAVLTPILGRLGDALRLPADSGGAPGRLDLVGVALLTVGLVAPLFALTRTATWGRGDPRTVGLIVSGPAVLVVFVFVERRITDPLVNILAGSVIATRPVPSSTAYTRAFWIAAAGIAVAAVAALLIPRRGETPVAVDGPPLAAASAGTPD